jgi:hypothetical protein
MMDTARAIGALIEVHPLETREDEAKAAQLLRAIKTVHAEGEVERKLLKAPHLSAGRAVDEAFRAPKKELERVEKLLKRRLAEAAERREAARLKALDVAREAVSAGDHEEASAAIESIDIAGLDSSAGISERWTYEVESVELRKVPIEFLILDQERVRGEIRTANREGREPRIEGVSFRRRASIVARKL